MRAGRLTHQLAGECSLPSGKLTTQGTRKQLSRFVEDAGASAVLQQRIFSTTTAHSLCRAQRRLAAAVRFQRVRESLSLAIDLLDGSAPETIARSPMPIITKERRQT